jgi:hypothetical protein
VCFGFPSAHVQSYFTHQSLGDHHIDAVDPRQIHAGDAKQFIGEVELRMMLALALLLLGFILRLGNSIRKTTQVFL